MTDASPSGMNVWFDPERETVKLYLLEPPEGSGVGEPCEGDDLNDSSDPDQVQLILPLEDDLPF